MPGQHDVYIIPDDHDGYIARPAVAAVVHGHGIKFRNLTGFTVTLQLPPIVQRRVTLPAKLVKSAAAKGVNLQSLPQDIPPGKTAHFHFKARASGLFLYTGYVQVSPTQRKEIVGESQPKIIVDP